MSQKYPGGFITKSPVAPTATAASGIWTLDQQQEAQRAGTWPSPPIFIEDLFSTWLYQSNNSGQTITNGIDLAGKGGLVWTKARGQSGNHVLIDTVRGGNNALYSNTTQATDDIGSGGITSFNSDGYTGGYNLNVNNNIAYCSWTFREQPKFFDVVTWTGDASGNRTLSHTLASTPGCIIIKATNAVDDWYVYHTSLGTGKWLYLNTTGAEQTGSIVTAVSSTTFTVSQSNGFNTNGRTYVAYLFAHNAGGFPASGTGSENGISCGSYVGTGAAGNAINLGYEPQWVMIKNTTNVTSWQMFDVMRGMPVPASGNTTRRLQANTSSAEFGLDPVGCFPTATGFTLNTANGDFNASGDNYIYIAIRRGPMKPPTTGTSVFAPVAYAGDSSATRLVNAGVNIDANISARRSGPDFFVQSRLTGVPYLRTRSVNAETSSSGTNGIPTILTSENNKFGFIAGASTLANVNETGSNYVDWAFTRAPTFLDVVCYTGTGANRTVAHNLTVAPEMMIVKSRSAADDWPCYFAALGATTYVMLNRDERDGGDSGTFWGSTAPTSSVFTVGTDAKTNGSGITYVAYLFASCPGVSKVGSFTGTGSTQVINCGFTGGARYVLIKATSTTGAWYVWDSARGIVAGDDPYLALNSSAAEVTNTDWVDTAASGFELSNAGGNLANSNGVSYIFLAIS